MKKYRPMRQTDGGADATLVRISPNIPGSMGKPWCEIHGAMNKVSPSERGGIWRCLQGQCRAGIEEVPLTGPESSDQDVAR